MQEHGAPLGAQLFDYGCGLVEDEVQVRFDTGSGSSMSHTCTWLRGR